MTRIFIYLIITIFCGFLFALVPAFNWVADRQMSLYQQFAVQGDLLNFLKHVGGLSLVIFISLLLLFGVKNKG